MKDIIVGFSDFWPSFDIRDNNFVRALRAKFNVVVADSKSGVTPQILIYSIFGDRHYSFKDCVKIYYTGENDVPDFNECDYALSFHHIDFDGRHLRYPLYMTYEIDEALSPPIISDTDALNRGFCSLLMRNSDNCAQMRLDIIDAVENYKPVTYGGPYRNNIGGPVDVDGKISFISGYKFNLALENSSVPGYVTEKIVEPFAAPTVPIYWGASDVENYFNPDAFINVGDFQSIQDFIDELRTIDSDPDLYLRMLRQPRLKEDQNIDFNERLSEFLCRIADTLEMKRPRDGMTDVIYRRNNVMRRTLHNRKLRGIMERLLRI